MKPVRCLVVAVGTFFVLMTVLSVVLFARCRCVGKQFSPYLCLIRHWTPPVRGELPPCRDNLITLEASKFEWARESGAAEGASVAWDDVRVYLPDGKEPVCGCGGHYLLNPVGDEPDCDGACCLHANPLEHALEPAALYAGDEGNPLASGRFTVEDWIVWRKGRPAPHAPARD